jgi:hypothetical protein
MVDYKCLNCGFIDWIDVDKGTIKSGLGDWTKTYKYKECQKCGSQAKRFLTTEEEEKGNKQGNVKKVLMCPSCKNQKFESQGNWLGGYDPALNPVEISEKTINIIFWMCNDCFPINNLYNKHEGVSISGTSISIENNIKNIEYRETSVVPEKNWEDNGNWEETDNND